MNSIDIPIFDSLTHPSLDGSWVSENLPIVNSFKQTEVNMMKANVRWAFAVTMRNTNQEDHIKYVLECAKYKDKVKFFPVAYMELSSFSSLTEVNDWLLERKRLGFLGVKLHPRHANFDFSHPFLVSVIIKANSIGLIPFLCTYFYSSNPSCKNLDNSTLRDLLYKVPDQKLVLLHAGGVNLLELSEITRHFKMVMLDLSFTMLEYADSSIEMDIRYVLKRCSRRVCIGSDSPEFSQIQLRNRFNQLTEGLDKEQIELIAYKNLFRFFELQMS